MTGPSPRHDGLLKTALKYFVVLVVTFTVFLALRSLIADVGGMPPVFKDAYPPSVFIRTGTFTPAILVLMSTILCHLVYSFTLVQEHMASRPWMRGLFFGLLFGALWFLGFIELVVVYGSSLERHLSSGLRDLISLSVLGLVSGLLFRTDRASTVQARGVIGPVLSVSVSFAAAHLIQYQFTLPAIEQRVDSAAAFAWLLITGAWIGFMYRCLGQRWTRPLTRALAFSLGLFGINWTLYTSFYLLFLEMPLLDTLVRCLFDAFGVLVGVLAFEQVQARRRPDRVQEGLRQPRV